MVSILRFLIIYNKVIDLGFFLTVVGADQPFQVQVEAVRLLPALMPNQVLLASE
jgi:hypothetical protein